MNPTNPVKGKHFCFTFNNPNTDLWETPKKFFEILNAKLTLDYCCFSKEVGNSGTKHFQGYLKTKYDVPFKKLKDVDKRFHWEKKLGTVEQAINYCKKDEAVSQNRFFEEGSIPEEQNKRGGEKVKEIWAATRKLAKSGNFEDIDDKLYIIYHSQIHAIAAKEMVAPDCLKGVCGIWIYGKAGCGKTQLTRKRWPKAYPKMLNKWWDGYKGEEVVLLDDVDPSHAPWIGGFMKNWGDSVNFIGEFKGGSKQIRPKLVVVTSQYSIDQVFSDAPTREAISRRYSEIHFGPLGKSLVESQLSLLESKILGPLVLEKQVQVAPIIALDTEDYQLNPEEFEDLSPFTFN